MPVRDAVGREDDLYERTMHYLWFADRFGWTPEQVDDQPQWFLSRAAEVAAVLDEVRAENAEAARGHG